MLGTAAQSQMVELSRLCLERQLRAEVGDLAVFGAAARSQMVELSRLCLEGQLGAKVMESAVFGAAAQSRRGRVEWAVLGVEAQSRSGGVGSLQSGSSEPKWGIQLCSEWQLGAEVMESAVLGAAARS